MSLGPAVYGPGAWTAAGRPCARRGCTRLGLHHARVKNGGVGGWLDVCDEDLRMLDAAGELVDPLPEVRVAAVVPPPPPPPPLPPSLVPQDIPGLCRWAGCESPPSYQRGLCRRHYRRSLSLGILDAVGTPRMSRSESCAKAAAAQQAAIRARKAAAAAGEASSA